MIWKQLEGAKQTMKTALTMKDREQRYEQFRAFLRGRKLDAALVCGDGAIKFLGGEYVSAWGTVILFPTQGDPVRLQGAPAVNMC